MSNRVNAGFIPLLDASLLIVAREKGFAAEEGIDLNLAKETSWANIRDRIAIGHFDVAHMLAPLPIAAALGKGPMDTEIIAPMALGLGGNAVTVSVLLWHEMQHAGATDTGDPKQNGDALKRVCEARKAAGRQGPVFGVVHRYSSHNYELRYWLAACGVRPDKDASFVVVPPPFMADAVAAGQIDGFCAGEPWNSHAVAKGVGVIATTKSAIWHSSPEKVLGVRAPWAAANTETLHALMRSMAKAAHWCGALENVTELSSILSQPDYLGQPPDVLARGLTGRMPFSNMGRMHEIQDFLIFDERAATFPWVSHALWFYTQMVRWGEFAHSPAAVTAARKTYRPDIYRAALASSGLGIPNASMKVEGALAAAIDVPTTHGRLTLGPDGFFDGRQFDPERIEEYMRADDVM